MAAGIEALQRAVLRAVPEQSLAQVVRRLVSRWRGESGVVFAMMTFLATQNDDIRAVYQRPYDVCDNEIERVLESLDPGNPACMCATRKRLTTALLDGSAMQTRVGDRRGYLQAVTEVETAIAIPEMERG